MKYMLLIYGDEAAGIARYESDPNFARQEMAEYYEFGQSLRDAGKEENGEALHPTASGASVRVRDGKVLTTHGPFSETKEQLGGFYLVDAADLDEAISWAAKIPGAREGSVEVRPVVDFGAMS
jgi:hypothetical protein